jgi:transposase-like protein
MRGRPPSGPQLVDETEGSDQARRRLKVMLETITGQKRIVEACAELGIGEAQFHKLRQKMLQGAIASLEPAAPGRPAAAVQKDGQELAGMEEEIRQLRIELRASQIREEIALLMPHLIKAPPECEKKTVKGMPSGGGKRDTPDKSGGSAS